MTSATPPSPSFILVFLRWVVVVGLGMFGLLLLAAALDQFAETGLVALVALAFLAAAFRLASPVRSLRKLRIAVGMGFVALLLTVFVLILPDLVRPRISANESATIGDLRVLVSAQAAYGKANAGHFDGRLVCLERPAECIPGYRADRPAFLTNGLTLPTRHQYSRTFHAGPAVSPVPSTASRSSVSSYGMTAAPLEFGQTGVRGFCADSTGNLCFTVDGSPPPVLPDGTCDLAKCTKLE